MKFIADFHIHSKYSRATSKDMDLPHISEWARWKGIDVVGSGDFTHPLWYSELKNNLKPDDNGLFDLVVSPRSNDYGGIKFILTTEVCNIFQQGGRLRKVHSMIFAPSLPVVEKINKELGRLASLMSDGRPILTIPVKKIAEIVFSVSSQCLLIPCHIWTPWFSVLGSNSGFASLEECFEEYTRNIYAVETGLSSDPKMNWRVSSLDRVALLSNSDAHSPSKLGGEANVFDTELSYKGITDAIKDKNPKKFLFTVEFYPEEGKYHYDGHRGCGVLWSPEETKKNKGRCPKCGKKVTVGVMSRVDELSDRQDGFVPQGAVPFKNLVPLAEIISEAIDKGVDCVSVKKEYAGLISKFGSEFKILLDAPIDELSYFMPEKIVEGIIRVRKGQLTIIPGYDGEYGTVKIFDDKSNPPTGGEASQMGLF